MNTVKVAVFFGGMPIKKDEEVLKKNCPHIVVGTPGRILALARQKSLSLKNIKHFILDECDKMLEALGRWSLLESHKVCCWCIVKWILIKPCSVGFWNVFLWCDANTAWNGRKLKVLLCRFRHETRCSRYLQDDTTREASDDVFCHIVQGYSTDLQEVHARCKYVSAPTLHEPGAWCWSAAFLTTTR